MNAWIAVTMHVTRAQGLCVKTSQMGISAAVPRAISCPTMASDVRVSYGVVYSPFVFVYHLIYSTNTLSTILLQSIM